MSDRRVKMTEALKPHEMMALRSLNNMPDRICKITSDEVFAAAVVYADLSRRGLVVIDDDDGMLVTISEAGRALLSAQDVKEG